MNRVASYLGTGTLDDVVAGLRGHVEATLGDVAPTFVFVAASPKFELSDLMTRVQSRFEGSTVFGCTSSGEFNEREDLKGAVSAVAVAGDFAVHASMGVGLSGDTESVVSQTVSELPPSVEGYPHRTSLLLTDPLTANGEMVTLLTAASLGEGARLAGGAAGDDLAMQSTSVALGAKVASDAMVVVDIHSKSPLGVGVNHGHEPITDSVTVTKSVEGKVVELDGKPAWSVWKDLTRGRAKELGVDVDTLEGDALSAFLFRFEGALSGAAPKIRAPLAVHEDGSMSFATGISEGATLRVSESEDERQVECVRRAAADALAQLDGRKAAGAIVFDCVCRKVILGDRFGEAIGVMRETLGDVPLAGFETYGEIALDAGDFSGFHNTTTVLLAIPE